MSAPCPACRAPRSMVFVATPRDREYFVARSAVIRRCAECSSLYQDPWPTATEAQGFYGADYQNYGGSTVPLLAQIDAAYQRREGTAFLGRHGARARVLDFGCGQGGFLRSLRAAGAPDVAGFDFVLYPELAAIDGVRWFDNLDALAASGLVFDVIRMRHVIEHLTDVDGTLALLAGLLAPGGCIVGETPNAGHYTARLMGGWWGPLHFPYHTVLFSVAGLRHAAERAGLALASTGGSLLPTGWAMSAENAMKAVTGSRRRGRSPVYAALMAASMPFALLDLLLGREATANFGFVLMRADRR